MSASVAFADPLNQPIHGSVPDGRPPWRDNAYVCFWDPVQEVVGVLHVSTSPNAEGRRARFSLAVGGRSIEIVEEPHDRGAFKSASVEYPLDDTIRVDGRGVRPSFGLHPGSRSPTTRRAR